MSIWGNICQPSKAKKKQIYDIITRHYASPFLANCRKTTRLTTWFRFLSLLTMFSFTGWKLVSDKLERTRFKSIIFCVLRSGPNSSLRKKNRILSRDSNFCNFKFWERAFELGRIWSKMLYFLTFGWAIFGGRCLRKLVISSFFGVACEFFCWVRPLAEGLTWLKRSSETSLLSRQVQIIELKQVNFLVVTENALLAVCHSRKWLIGVYGAY